MVTQPRLPGLSVPKGDYGPVASLAHAAKHFAKARGYGYSSRGLHGLRADPNLTMNVGKAYDEAIGTEASPSLRQSYESMRGEVGEQYRYLTTPKEQGGLGIKHEVTHEDPYATPDALKADVTQHGRIKTFASRTTGPHSVFSYEENDQFRAVHDAFGHLAIGRDFGRHGEEAAARHHAMMFSPASHEALFTETRGQNSYYHSRGGQFPDQSLVSIPSWASKANPTFPGKRVKKSGTQQMRLF